MMEALLRPLHAPATRLLTAEQEEELRAMGYTDF